MPGMLLRLAGRLRLGWTEAGFLALVLGALGLRLWELDGRAMHYDEAIHLQASWRLAEGHEYLHSAWMHGPFQIEFTALIFWMFGDTDFTARVGYALFGAALVGLPYFLKDHMGRTGALFTGVLLALSPSLLYFSRFGRNDIIMAFWAASLLVLMWRYFHDGRDGEGRTRYLFMASAVLAFMFATKETAYIVTPIFMGIAFLLALPDLAPLFLKRVRLSQLAGPAGFFLLLVTLTLPQWMAFFSLFQSPIGLVLANREGAAGGLVGAPQWAGPNVIIPFFAGPWWFHGVAALLAALALGWLPTRHGGPGIWVRRLAPRIGVPIAVTAATILAVLRPLGSWAGATAAEMALAGVLVVLALAVLAVSRHPWRKSCLLFLAPAVLTALYLAVFTHAVDVESVVHWILPNSVRVDAGPGAIPVNYLLAGGLLLGALALSVYLGVRWMGGRWLGMAAIFYTIWITLYTTFFTNLAGVFSGVWQGVGYWIAQQDVARGNQPWYYYFVGLSVYEFLPVFFGVAGAVYFIKKGHLLGVAVTVWAAMSTLIYTITSEKMPWLLVNVALPFIFLAGMYLGDLANRVQWRQAGARATGSILVLMPLLGAAGLYLVYALLDQDQVFGLSQWGLLASAALVCLAAAFLVRIATPRQGMAMVGLGMAALLLALGVWASLRASYTYDDSNVEILVYAQGADDLRDTFNRLNSRVFHQDTQGAADAPDVNVVVDYDVWYPFQWYVRNAQDDGELSFACFKGESEDGWNDSCKRVSDGPTASARVLTMGHGDRDGEYLAQFEKRGPLQNLLWFPESYRRPDENRQAEGSFWGFRGVPSKEQFTKDLGFFRSSAISRDSWFRVLDYWLFRQLERDWYDAKYYSYLP
ncbi:MAG: hypothetical protein BZY80_01840 [SAR202 cluster bacterium Io17-Chloro-G2]|nr:MAG: hypothetical protein BZY80_01840 [SAR202 cluster bacterium Io17-Chloro-G2]